jgi:8-oxo-dGTP pyrophosphatase MutT (NUDIX family)
MLIANEILNPNETEFQSHLGVYGIIQGHDPSKILVMKKMRGTYNGLFDLPGGSVELHETFEEALEREVYEETGCMIGPYRQIKAAAVRYPYKEDGVQKCLRHMGILFSVILFGTPKTGDADEGECVFVDAASLNASNATPFAVMAAEHLLSQKTA